MASKEVYTIWRKNAKLGDFSIIQIRAGLTSNQLSPGDVYWHNKTKSWIDIQELVDAERAEELVGMIILPAIGLLGIIVYSTKFHRSTSHLNGSGKFFVFAQGEWPIWGWTAAVGLLAAIAWILLKCHENPAEPKPFLKRGLWAIALMSLATGSYHSPSAKQMCADFNPLRSRFHYEPFGDFRREIFPSIELAFAHLNEKAVKQLMRELPDDAPVYRQRPQGSTIGVILHEVKKGDLYTVEVSSDEGASRLILSPLQQSFRNGDSNSKRASILKVSSFSFVAQEDTEIALANPELIFDFKALTQVTQTQPINLTFKVSRNGGTPFVTTQVWQLRQLRDCPIGIKNQTLTKSGRIKEDVVNTAFFFSAYVNENHPMMDRLIAEALGTGKVSAFTGYQGNRNSILLQMEAIWTALEKRDIKYSSITTTTGSELRVQHVRLIEDILRGSQANCVEGSILFASIARKVGLEPLLVIVPGHCYVAIDAGNDLIAIEMTMLGRRSFHDSVEWATTQSPKSLSKNLINFTRSSQNNEYFLVSIKECREFGIQPIPYTGK